MNNASDNFEIFLRGALKDAAACAPPAPSVFVLRQRLRRRSLARAGWVAAAALVALATALLFSPILDGRAGSVQTAVDYWRGVLMPSVPVIFNGPQDAGQKPVAVPDRTSGETETPPQPIAPEVLPVPVEPLPPSTLVAAFEPMSETGDFALLQEALTVYFSSRGIRRAEIIKRPGAEIDFVLNATGVVDFAQVALDFETLLKKHDHVGISFRDGLVACWLFTDMRS